MKNVTSFFTFSLTGIHEDILCPVNVPFLPALTSNTCQSHPAIILVFSNLPRFEHEVITCMGITIAGNSQIFIMVFIRDMSVIIIIQQIIKERKNSLAKKGMPTHVP